MHFDSHHSSGLRAVVQGSEPYVVELDLVKAGLGVFCTCPRFEETLCKHIWPVLNTAQGL